MTGIRANEFRAMNRFWFHPKPASVNAGELRAKEKNLRGKINPHQHDDQRTHRTINRGDAAPADINANQKLSQIEKQRGNESAQPHVPPRNFHIGQEFEDHRE